MHPCASNGWGYVVRIGETLDRFPSGSSENLTPAGYIYMLEVLAQILAVVTLSALLPEDWVVFIDNAAGQWALNKGYGRDSSTWICHPFSGFSVYFFLKAHELGKWQGNLLMEMEKERVYTRLDNLDNPCTGYVSGFGDVPGLLYTNQALIDAEFRSEDFIDFPMPGPKDKR